MKVKFKIEKIIYSKDDFIIAKSKIIKIDSSVKVPNSITIKGNIKNAYNKATYEANFEKKEDYVYGYYLQVSNVVEKVSSSQEAQKKYMLTHIKGVGKKTIDTIIEMLGSDAMNEISSNPKCLDKLIDMGLIKKNKADRVAKEIRLSKVFNELMEFAKTFDIPNEEVNNIFNEYGESSIISIENDPYEVGLSLGYDFYIMDRIASKIKRIEYCSNKRVNGAILYLINDLMHNNGDVAVYRSDIIDNFNEFIANKGCFNELLKLSDGIINRYIDNLINEERLIEEDDLIYKKAYYDLERRLANNIKKFNKSKTFAFDFDSIFNLFDVELCDEQKEAIKSSLNNKLTIITGGPGTGKSLVISKIVQTIEAIGGKTISLLSPTGKAADNLKNLTGRQASTIHSALGIMGFGNSKANNTLESDYVIVDECSMIDMYLFNELFSNISDNTQVILVGDVDQLPSIGIGNVLKDLIDSGKIPVVRLTKIFRQSEQNNIVTVSRDIINGKDVDTIDLYNYNNDCYFIEKDIEKDISDEIINLYNKFIIEGQSINDILILSPMKAGLSGTDFLNKTIQDIYNPYNEEYEEFKIDNNNVFRVGDKVINNKNNSSLGVMNGEIGIVSNIYKKGSRQYIDVLFNGKEDVITFNKTESDNLSLAYAITVHKSQGSECNIVLMPISKLQRFMLNRNLIYTGITRAKQKMIMVGNKETLKEAISKTGDNKRKSHLVKKI